MDQKVRDDEVRLNGLTFHYRDWGGTGQPIVLVHGLASTCHIWNLVAPLLAVDYRVVALDQRGHGQSAQPDGPYDFAAMVADLRAFLDALRLSAPVLVGHSWGGNVVLEYAAACPQDTRALALVDGGFLDLSLEPDMTWEHTQEMMKPPNFDGMTYQALVEEIRSRDRGFPLTPEVEQVILTTFHVHSDGTIEPRLRRDNHMKILRALWEQRPASIYPRVQCPVLIVVAVREPSNERDSLFLRHKQKAVPQAEQALGHCRTLWMEDTVHDVPLQRPQELAEAIKGLLRSAAGQRPES